jgi:hypothetical protein
MISEGFGDHILPGIQLEDIPDRQFFQIGETLTIRIPADFIHKKLSGIESCLYGAVAQVLRCSQVFEAVSDAGEVQGASYMNCRRYRQVEISFS